MPYALPGVPMPSPIIQVENLSKLYRIGLREKNNRTFREAVVDAFSAPVRNFNRLRRLNKFTALPHSESNQSNQMIPDTIWALKDISFEVQPGEVIGIIGRNGAGKSTLLKILSRITEPTSGEIILHGRVASLLEVGTGFHPELTGRENIYLNGTILGMRKAEIDRKFDEIVAFSEIEKFLDTPVKRYSSGMYVRLAFAVAAHLEPEILLVDEVLAVGDTAFQKKCLGKMEDVANQGRTVLFVSHNMAAVQQLCSRSILLTESRLSHDGRTPDVIEEYLFQTTQILSTTSISNKTDPDSIVFSSISILNSQNDFSSMLLYGEPFSVWFDCITPHPIHNLGFHLAIDAYNGTRIFTSDSEEFGFLLFGEAGTHRVSIHFDSFHLMPGKYRISKLMVRQGKHEISTLTNILSFEISEQSFSGKSPSRVRSGLIAGTSEWKLI